ncbi:MAG: alcohol dehydrogenase catalytic domain-containing protein, partial [Actinomycetota bacterium]|nr:alcohol dehydrogenase catalytic domain-containing protein [Actinomycetota bacterium]
MKAWQVHELGEPRDVLQLAEIHSFTAESGQVRVRVLAAAANFPDVLMCRGLYQVRPPLPFTPGVEVCGEVLEGSAGTSSLSP